MSVATLLLLLLCLTFGVIAPLSGWTNTLAGVLAAALLLLPVPLHTFGNPQLHYGIAPSAPTVYVYLPILLALSLALRRSNLPGALYWMVALFWVYLLVGLGLIWESNQTQISGALHLATASIAFVVGFQLAKDGFFTGTRYERALRVLLAFMTTQVVFCAAQLAGLAGSLFNYTQVYLDEGRAVGTFDHPSTLGKVALLTLIVALPGTSLHSRAASRTAWAIAGMCIAVSGLTLARANTVGIIAAVVAWVIIDRGATGGISRKVSTLAAVCAVSVPAIEAALARFSVDRSGGQRELLTQVGLPFVREYFIAGMGPNYYVEIVGQFDATTASGYPIHNTFLLASAELGALGAILLFLPLLWTLLLAIRRWRRPDLGGAWARALLVAVPALALVTWTGWGMLSGGTLTLWFLILGVCAGSMSQETAHTQKIVRSPCQTTSGPVL